MVFSIVIWYAITSIMPDDLKPVNWIASSRKDLRSFPKVVQIGVGFALYEAQRGKKHDSAKPLKGYKGAGVLEVVEDHDGNTYRAVYTVRFAEIIYVLHCFQKKSKSGVATLKQDLDKVESRLKAAEKEYQEWKNQQGK